MAVNRSTRLVYLDALRGLAILLMVQDHAFDWWLRGEFHPTPWGRITEFLGTLAAPLFLFLMGFSLALSIEKRLQGDLAAPQVALSLLRRGVFLILQGYVVTWLVFYNGWNLEEMGAVDVLHCLGLSMLVLIPLALGRSWPLTALASVAAAAVSLWAGSWDLPSWLAAWLTGTSGISYFPLLPFVVYALVGLALGLLYRQMAGHPRKTRWFPLALAALGTGIAVMVPLVPPTLGARFPRPQFLLFSLALILYLTALFYALGHHPGLLRPLAVMGQTAMMLYIWHQLVGFRLFYHLGWVTGHSWEGQYGVFDPALACLLLAVLLGFLYGMAELWLAWRPRIGPAALVRRWAPRLSAYW
jgi:uncharacterized membrane protein